VNEQATAHLRITVKDQDERKVGRAFSDAAFALALGGYAGFHTTTPPTAASAFGLYWPALVPAAAITQRLHLPDGSVREIPHTSATSGVVPSSPPPALSGVPAELTSTSSGVPAELAGPLADIPLGRLCGARSGDKGGNANVGLWATSPARYAWLRQYLTTDRFKELLTEAADLHVDRYELPNLLALNFVVHGLLAPGVSGTARPDAQAKGLGEYLRCRVVTIPASMISL
jgi:hypothetical protein